jgi:hypothetical protein
MSTQPLEEFKRRLAQTIFWCAPRANTMNPESCLRTPALRPPLLAQNRFYTVDTVVNARELSAGAAIRNARIPDELGGGRLLVYFPESDLFCGAAADQTDGFFDVNNVPPWDTWVTYWQDQEPNPDSFVSEYLIAWVPPSLIELANEGINVNPEQCIMWLAETSVELARALRAEKLLA